MIENIFLILSHLGLTSSWDTVEMLLLLEVFLIYWYVDVVIGMISKVMDRFFFIRCFTSVNIILKVLFSNSRLV